MNKQNSTMGLGWKKEPWEKLSAQPASTAAAAYQGSLGQTAPSYAPGAQIMGRTEPKKQTEPEKQEKPSDIGAADVGAAVPSGPSTFSPLPTPAGRNETEELRTETRQRTQLAKGVSPETLAEKETVNQSRTYRPTSRDLERQYVSLQTQIDSVEKLLGKNSIYQETEPDAEAEEQMRTLRDWKGILERERDSLAVPYYTMENEEKRSALAGDREGQRQFQNIGESREDMRRLGELVSGYDGSEEGQQNLAYLMGKYGMTERELRQKAPQLIRELQGQWDAGVEQLDGLGYDYDRMMSYDKRLQNARRDALRQENLEMFAQEHPVWASAASLGMAPLQAAEFGGTALSGIGHSDPTDLKNYVPMDPHSMRATNAVNTLRGTVAREIEENTDWELFGQNVASFLYQTGMSIGDSALQVGTLGRAATLFMGGSAAANQARSVLERGGSNAQAFWGGLASGAAEMLFEYASIDNLLTPRTVTGWESFLKETAKQAGVEGSEELFTEIANILSDAAIMGEKSETAWKTAEYESLGMSREEAEKRTFLDCIGQAAWAAAGGTLSGAVMGGTVNGANLVETRQTSLVSDATADQMLLERTTVDFLTRKGGLKLRKGMTQEQKRAAVRQAVENVVHKEKPASTGEAGKYRAVKPRNVELPTVPIIEISLDEVAQLNGGVLPQYGGYVRDTVIERAKVRLGLDKREAAYIPASNISRSGEEYILKVTKTTLKKMFSPSDGGPVPVETAAIVEHLEQIANNAVWYDGEGDRKGRKQIQGIDHLITTVYIDGVPTAVDMTVRITQQNNKADPFNILYYLEPEVVKILK